MAEVAVREGIGAVLKPHDDRMDFAGSPDTRMMDVEIHDKAGDGETERRVQRV